MPQATQPRHVRISEADGLQRVWQGFLVELRVIPRAWYRSHIHKPLRAMSLQEVQEDIKLSRGMTNGQHDDGFFHGAFFKKVSP